MSTNGDGSPRRVRRRAAARVRRGVTAALVAVLVGATAWAATPARTDRPEVQAMPGGTGRAPAAPQTVAAAATAARAAGKPVEVTGLRAERQQVYANPDGTLTRLVYQQPVNVAQNGRWVPADATLVRHPDGSIGSRAATTGLRLSGGGTGTFASVERAGRRYGLVWPGRLPAPELSGATATYRDALPGVDLVVRAGVTGFSHVLVVRTAEAARNPGLRRLRLGLDLRLITARVTADGGLVLADSATGGVVFDTPPARMWDSAVAAPDGDLTAGAPDGAATAPVGLAVDAGALTLVPDATVLDSPATTYPVYVDPFTSGGSNESWTMTDSGYPNDEYWKFSGENNERVGYCPVGVSGQVCNSSRIKRLFYVLPTAFSGMTILEAKFRVTLQHTYDSTPRNVSLYRAGSGGALITSATNWNNMPGGAGMSGFVKQQTIAPTGTTGCETGATRNTEFDAFEAVSTAANSGWSKTTFLIRADNESSYLHLKRFCNNAVLSVKYNRAPDRPALSALSLNPGGACVAGASRPYVSSLPTLKAVLTDPDTADAEPLRAEFQVNWTEGGTAQSRSWTSSELANGSTFSYNLADPGTGVPALPENTVVSWKVRAGDGTATGPWSSDNGGSVCEFILDKTKPSGPDIDSPQYLPGDAADNGTANAVACVDDQTWHAGVGRYGTFTFDSAATDVVEYRYGFDTNPTPTLKANPAFDGGPVSVAWQPQTDGPHTVNVVAVDHAGKQSDISSCTFRVAAGTAPIARWRLDDATGSPTAADTAGASPLTAGAAAQFGVAGPGGAADRAARFNGVSTSGLSTGSTVVDTGHSFTVSLWVRLNDLTRYQTILSQDGSGEPGFIVAYAPTTGRWFANVPVNDVQSLGSWNVAGPVAEAGKWTHLTVVYDDVTLRQTMYVNGVQAGSGSWRSPWSSHGPIQVGRRYIRSGIYGDSLNGDVADIKIWDRAVVPGEAQVLPTLLTKRLGYWDLDAATPVDDQPPLVAKSAGYGPPGAGGGTEIDPALELGLYGGATVYMRNPDDPFAPSPLVGDGHLVLDGATGYAATAGPVVATNGSFSAAARVQVATDCTAAPMTLLSLPGTHAGALTVGCVPDGAGGALWRASVSAADADGAATTVVTGDGAVSRPDPGASAGQFVVVTYDAAYQQLKLYADGQLIGTAGNVATPWTATGGLQIGRSLTASVWGGALAGVVDEVRVYSGPLAAATVQQLNTLTEVAEL
ncbi:LamG-like jellyroll fold domain-containing protein [Dactylosporangium sp. AC04546]|uniref:LamG-like jellyroll fold domain-containing protein n=1 Tax=Dactylosporangium sp. AC04546 TaxID=2862460 RepID=UPI001EE04D15|nr:LamG-like jellyroll fold domain-containing protein [Dactylosporangium sp. AC04546]WVK84855.1 LamG-like jellyroll fold domain-containing protein [Dactylosporangium sp. AC04546]